MQHEFWHEAWARDKPPGWQQTEVNPHLVQHWVKTNALPAEAVFVPLCGASIDMVWLREFGHHVVGVDLSVSALRRFCEQQSIDAVCERDGDLTVFRAPGWTLYAGDIFKLQAEHIARVSRVYDRAALVALPPAERRHYASHMCSILPGMSEIFVITMAYDQNKMKGPPFSVTDEELFELFGSSYSLKVLQSASGSERLGNLAARGLDELSETSFLLQPKVET